MSEDPINPAFQRILQYFQYQHLPVHLQLISAPLCQVAHDMVIATAGSNNPAEVTVGLRKLLEAKDCFVRAMV